MAVAYQYKVEGINCINCANGIKNHLSKMHITKVNIDISKGIVTIYNDQYKASEIEQFIDDLKSMSVKDSAEAVAMAFNVPRRDIYQLALQIKSGGD